MDETKVIYHIDDEDTPYLVKLFVSPEKVTLGDLKNVLSRPNVKFFFKTMDDDFGVVKEEISDESTKLPFFKGRVICWMVTSDETQNSDCQSINTETQVGEKMDPDKTSINDDRSNSSKANNSQQTQQKNVNINEMKKLSLDHHDPDDTYTESDSQYSADRVPPLKSFRDKKPFSRMSKPYTSSNSYRSHPIYDTSSSMMSSDLETTSFFDSEDESSRFSTATGTTTDHDRQRRQYRRRKMPPISRASSFSSITDSTMTLNVITVTLPMDKVNYLGISLVAGDGCVSVGSIMKEGAVALDGRIDPGDIILEVNGISFESLDRDAAVQLLRESAQRPGPITLVVAKGWDNNPKGYLSIPRQEPVRPIDPRAWVLHTNAMTGASNLHGGIGNNTASHPMQAGVSLHPCGQPLTEGLRHAGSNGSGSSSITSSSLPESEQRHANEEIHLTVDTDMITTIRALTQPDSGLEIRDRTWLKIRIPNAFIGSDLVDWLMTHVDGFADRKDAHKYASNLLKFGYIRHTVNKVTFSEQCYYVVGNMAPAQSGASQANLEDVDSVSEMGNRYPQGMPQPPSSKWGPPYYGAGNMAPPLPGYLPYPTQGGAFPSGGANQNSSNPAYLSNNQSKSSKTEAIQIISDQNSGGAPSTGPLSQSGGRPLSPSTIVSGSAGDNCVCLLSTYKAMKGFWRQDKELPTTRQSIAARNYPKRKPSSPPVCQSMEMSVSSPILPHHSSQVQSILSSPLLQPPSGGSGMSSVRLATSVQGTPNHSLHSSSCLSSSFPTVPVTNSALCDLLSFSRSHPSAACPNLDVVHAATGVSFGEEATHSGSEGRKNSSNPLSPETMSDEFKIPPEDKNNFPKSLPGNPSPCSHRRNFVQV